MSLQEEQSELAGGSWLQLWFEVTHRTDMYIGVERCAIGQHTKVFLLLFKGQLMVLIPSHSF